MFLIINFPEYTVWKEKKFVEVFCNFHNQVFYVKCLIKKYF